MKYKRTKVIATFHISITDKDYNYSCYDTCSEEGDDYYKGVSGIPEQMNIISNLQSQICQHIG